MRYVKFGISAVLILIVAGFLHYILPQRDVVQIVGTDVIRRDVESSDGRILSQDVRYINARTDGGESREYRNEDTGWGFPFYFKFDSGKLAAEAQSMAKDDGWVAVTHYGWRITFLSMYPNAVKLKPVAGPDVRLIPWFNIVFLIVLAAAIFAIWRRIQRFRENRIDPVLDDLDRSWDETTESASGFWQRLRDRFRR
ncbi:DUF1523 domain-containing protein [Maritimibacter sp. 55A14]|uniref:DUF1523 family protein n=1 Tax=Maritimibacter sp. 55A14 TaxID=2174844 RepID=UPI000D61FC45|nr:DUF1523 family protein [Maritimibacter sp. 55A14]PWE31374.1 DUF1523 domain-containing protein [Maritimibacter sp. 55A14]